LFYDYTTNNTGWKLKVDEVTTTTGRFDKIVMYYEIGGKNVVNSIIPKEGYNAGVGTTLLERFQGYSDFYNTLSDIEYKDASADFIDDYSCTFNVNMTGQYGNGQASSALNEYINYSEAFLFNGLDEMFSIVYLPSSFAKNDTSAFLISWTILAPIG
jgi:hypothetical protein